ncbi:MAG: glycerate 2-kinase [Pseudonocardiales bacterium]|nr:glycerate 2-kinase [Pseudonocardiales bacterium]
MRILLCLDKFRGSATAAEASAALESGIRDRRPDIDVVTLAIADGGEGTVDALVSAGFRRHTVAVSGPLGETVQADLALRDGHAVIEMAQASGLHLIAESPAPLTASTFGTGELVREALDLASRSITITVGGSASTDGGAGMLQALGARLTTAGGDPIEPGGGGLAELDSIDLSALDPRLADADVSVASDVDNPLLGPTGAAAVFGPQKGATPRDVDVLESGLRRLADVMRVAVGEDYAAHAGAGAAGGTGFGALAGLHATRRSGIAFMLRETGVEAALADADLVVVGEGSLDEQSLGGKAPIGVASLARERDVPVIAVAGQVLLSTESIERAGLVRTYSILDRAGDVAVAMSEPQRFLFAIGGDIAEFLAP